MRGLPSPTLRCPGARALLLALLLGACGPPPPPPRVEPPAPDEPPAEADAARIFSYADELSSLQDRQFARIELGTYLAAVREASPPGLRLCSRFDGALARARQKALKVMVRALSRDNFEAPRPLLRLAWLLGGVSKEVCRAEHLKDGVRAEPKRAHRLDALVDLEEQAKNLLADRKFAEARARRLKAGALRQLLTGEPSLIGTPHAAALLSRLQRCLEGARRAARAHASVVGPGRARWEQVGRIYEQCRLDLRQAHNELERALLTDPAFITPWLKAYDRLLDGVQRGEDPRADGTVSTALPQRPVPSAPGDREEDIPAVAPAEAMLVDWNLLRLGQSALGQFYQVYRALTGAAHALKLMH